MSRTKGYKCFNIKCGSCIGKTLCGEPEDTALVCVDRVVGKPMTNADRIRAMSDEELAVLIAREIVHVPHSGFYVAKSAWLRWLHETVEEQDG